MKALWLCLCLGLAACADIGTKTWYRADGSPAAPGQLEADKVACQQEMKKPQATRAAGLDRDVVQPDVYESCMTRLGYSDTKTSAPAPASPAPAIVAAPAAAPAGTPRGAAPPVTASRGAPAGTARPGVPPAAAPATAAVAPPGAPPAAPPVAVVPPVECRKLTDLRMWLPPCS
jgi:hypothetical protein